MIEHDTGWLLVGDTYERRAKTAHGQLVSMKAQPLMRAASWTVHVDDVLVAGMQDVTLDGARVMAELDAAKHGAILSDK